jgi:hypothetical protein
MVVNLYFIPTFNLELGYSELGHREHRGEINDMLATRKLAN